jgi:imidazolonepropionase-like amidohydrolase
MGGPGRSEDHGHPRRPADRHPDRPGLDRSAHRDRKQVGPAGEVEVPAGADLIDLTGATVLPGLIDAHTHVLLQGDITQADYDEQLLKESIPYRTIRATVAVKTALWNGFTAIRDLETEGAMYADVDLKHAIDRGIVPGPRMFVSTRALSATGMYPLLG